MYDRGSSYNPLFAPVIGALRSDDPPPECIPPTTGTLDAVGMVTERADDMRAMMQLAGMSPANANTMMTKMLAILNEVIP
jgi:hypothetical protein